MSHQTKRGTHLEEDLAEYPIRLLPEDGREDDGDAVRGGLDIDRLLVTIVDRHHLACRPIASMGAACFKFTLRLERTLERCSEGVALQERYRPDQRFTCLCEL